MKLEDDIRLLKLKKECLLAANSYNDKVLNDYFSKFTPSGLSKYVVDNTNVFKAHAGEPGAL